MDPGGNSTAVAIEGRPPINGNPWRPCRVVALSGDTLLTQLSQSLPDRSTIHQGRQVLMLHPGDLAEHEQEWVFWELAIPLASTPKHASLIAQRQLEHEGVAGFAVSGCLVWIGEDRYWVAYDPPWPRSRRPAAAFPLPTHAPENPPGANPAPQDCPGPGSSSMPEHRTP